MKPLDYLSSGDTLFLDIESDVNPMYVGACLVFESDPSLESDGGSEEDPILAFIESRLSTEIRYTQRVSRTPLERRPIWSDSSDFDIRRHVERECLPPGSGEAVLKARAAEFAAEPMDPAHPLWQVRLVDGFAKNRYAMLIKAHHCLADGVAGIELLRALLSNTPEEKVDSNRLTPRARVQGTLDQIGGEIRHRADATASTLRQAADAIRHPGSLVDPLLDGTIGFLHLLKSARRPVSRTMMDAQNSSTRSLDWMDSDLKRISRFRRQRGGTLNDVVVATVALALGRFFEKQGIPVAEQRQMEIRVAVPVNMRTRSASPETGNRISMLFARLPIGEKSPLRVFEETRDSLSSAKESHSADLLGQVLSLGEWVPRTLTRQLTRLAVQSHPANLVVTNVPGPKDPLYLMGSRLLAAYPIVPLMPGQALAVAVLSYAGTLHWGFHADPQPFPDLESWSAEVSAAFEDLLEGVPRE